MKIISPRFSAHKSEFTWFILAQIVTLIAPLAFTRLYADTLEPKIFGEVSLWLAVSIGVSLITYSPNCAAATKYISADRDSDIHIRKHIKTIYHINYRDISTSSGIFLLVALVLVYLYKDTKYLISAVAAFSYFIAQSAFTIRYTIANALRLRKLAFAISSIELIPRYIITTLCFSFVTPTLLTAFGAIAFWSLLSWQLFRQLSRKKLIFTLQMQPCSYGVSMSTKTVVHSRIMRQYSRPLKYAGIIGFIQTLSDSFVLLYYHGPTAVAAFGILLKSIYTPISYGIAQLVSFVEPVIFRKYASSLSKPQKYKHGLSQSLIFSTTIFTVITLLCAMSVVGLRFMSFVSGRFNTTNLFVPAYCMGVSALLFCVAQFQVLMITAKRDPRTCLTARLSYSSILIIANVLLGRFLSVSGISFSYLLASLVYYCYIQLIYYRTFRSFLP